MSESEAGTFGAVDPKVTRPVPHPFEPDPLMHGLGTADDPDGALKPKRIATADDGVEGDTPPFGLGSENTQDTPPEPQRAQPDPLAHGLGSDDSQPTD